MRREVELHRYGFTDGCRGSIAARKGGRAVTQGDECRRRRGIETAMAEDDEVRAGDLLREVGFLGMSGGIEGLPDLETLYDR